VLKARYPQLKLYLREDLTPRLIAALKSGALDAAVIALPYDTAGLDYARVGDDEILAAAPLDHPLAKAARVEAGALNPDDLILLEDGHCLRDHALSACRLEAPKGEDVFAATSLQTLMQMVSAGLGVSFVPEMAVKAGLGGDGVAIRPLERNAPKREIVVAWRAGSSRKREGELLAEVFRD
jgi:LysR family hydrogen peroxide-inducible transcriptional activator